MPKPNAAFYARALRALTRRDHTRAELTAKLLGHGPTEAVEAVLDTLSQQGYLDDRRYAFHYVAARGNKSGARRLGYELRQRGIAEAFIQEALHGAELDEAEHLIALWQRRFGVLPQDLRNRATQYRYLAGRGFSPALINTLLSGKLVGA